MLQQAISLHDFLKVKQNKLVTGYSNMLTNHWFIPHWHMFFKAQLQTSGNILLLLNEI